MNTKAAAAILTVTAASGVLGAAWWLNTQNAPEPAPQPQPAPEPEPQPAALDMFSIPTTPSPAAVFFQSVNGTPIPARARREVNSWLSMMESLVDRMNEFDADGDGMLSDLEKIAMGYRLRKEFIADYDLDGDGEMSGAEWRAFQRGLFEQSAQGQLLMQQFDADADGVLNEEEQAAMDAHLEQQEEQRRAEDRARADTDGDGQLSEDERRAARQQERQFWQSQMTAAENNFDRDGDGELNIEESRDAWDAWVEYQTVDAFINDYDTDGDRAMGPADYDAFLSQYGRRSRKADVNADGEINVQDINAFRDLVLRSRSM
jgi:Ca2+-binding EF-hand superfamily protein